MIARELDCSYYAETILFYTDCTVSKCVNHLVKKYKVDKSELSDIKKHSRTVGFSHNAKDYFVIWYRHPDDLSTLVHELYHLCTMIFNYKGVPITVENDETMAYYMGYWIKKFLAILKEENVSL